MRFMALCALMLACGRPNPTSCIEQGIAQQVLLTAQSDVLALWRLVVHKHELALLQGLGARVSILTHLVCVCAVLCCGVVCRSNGRGPELTPAALEAHNKTHSSLSLVSHGSTRSLDASTAANLPALAPSAAYLARMQKVGDLSCPGLLTRLAQHGFMHGTSCSYHARATDALLCFSQNTHV